MDRRTVRLPYHPPYDWTSALTFLARRAIEGVEQVEAGHYRRLVRCEGQIGAIDIAHDEARHALVVTVVGLSAAATRVAAARVRTMFDLDADLDAIRARLSRDPAMAPLVASRPATRVLRGWDGFEVAARSIIGQQVSVAHARRLNGTLVDRCGAAVRRGLGAGLDRVFPAPQQVLRATLTAMGMPGARVIALQNVAHAALADPQLFARADSIETTVARLRAIGGIGDWTAHYIAMRACGEPDAFPASDVGLLRGAADATGRRPTARELLSRAAAWRPWRAYAAHHLWAVDGANASDSIARAGVPASGAGAILDA